MKKNCQNCWYGIREEGYCDRYDCLQNEVAKEKDNPSCWEIIDDFADSHTCDYENGCCKICGEIEYKSMLYCELYGCDPD